MWHSSEQWMQPFDVSGYVFFASSTSCPAVSLITIPVLGLTRVVPIALGTGAPSTTRSRPARLR